MSQVAIYKWNSPETNPQTFLEHVEAITDSIRKRAFNLFQNRNGGNGSDLDDWLQAERDLAWSPASELVDDEKEFRARIALPGFDAKDIQVSALPDALVIQAGAAHTHEGKSGNVCFCEFSGKKLFRRLDLPAFVDVDMVTASVDKGILLVTAPKATTKQMTAWRQEIAMDDKAR
jgi:HSP20 family molecular chaperone IbpA